MAKMNDAMTIDESYSPGKPDRLGNDRLIVLSGCSGAGKSTIIAALAKRGFAVQPEAGREIVREQMQINGTALPWVDPGSFVELLVSRAMAQFNRAAQSPGPVFFDRGVVDGIAFLRFLGLAVPSHLARVAAMCRYAGRVFMTPPWRALFINEAERNKTFDQAVGEYDALIATYDQLGYQVVDIPRDAVAARVAFVIDQTVDADRSR